MLVVEAKLKNGTPEQYHRLDEAIRTSQFVRNSCVRHWIENKGTTRNDLQKLCAVLANNKETPWVNKLNSQARQSAADRAWQSINRFYQNCHAKIPGKKGFRLFGLCDAMDGGYKGWNPYIERHLAIFVNSFRSRAN
jgi:putative transposase